MPPEHRKIRRIPFTETINRNRNEEDRYVGRLQPGPRSGEDIPNRFRDNVDYTQTDAPDKGPLNRRGV
jgi:hypothetical protein